jgi:hypothetical protein
LAQVPENENVPNIANPGISNGGNGGNNDPVNAYSSNFTVDMTACKRTFNWEQYLQNLKNGRTNSAPYTKEGCVNQTQLAVNGQLNVQKYKNFEVGQQSTKNSFGELNVLALTEQNNHSKTFQQDVNYLQKQNLDKIFTQEQLNTIFSSIDGNYSQASGMPKYYHNGHCTTKNGELKYVDEVDGEPFDPTKEGLREYVNDRDCAAPADWTTGTLDENTGETTVETSLQVYQFVYEVPYPNQQQCNQLMSDPINWFNSQQACSRFYETWQGKYVAGDDNLDNGSKFVYTDTFFGSFDDQMTQWVGWREPEVGNREDLTAEDFNGYESRAGYARNFDGYAAYEF